jgi:hypothetical protein
MPVAAKSTLNRYEDNMELLNGYGSSSSSDSVPETQTGGRKRRLDAGSSSSAQSGAQSASRSTAASKQGRSHGISSDRFHHDNGLSSFLAGLPEMEVPSNVKAQGPATGPLHASRSAEAGSAANSRQTAAARLRHQQQQWQSQSQTAAAASPRPAVQAAEANSSLGAFPHAGADGTGNTASAEVPVWAARLDKRTARELAALGMLPSSVQAPSGHVAGGVATPAVAHLDSQALYGSWNSQSALKGTLAVPDKRNVTVGYYNSHGEGVTTTSAPTRGQKRKNQVNQVAAHFFRNENNYAAADAAAAAHKRSSKSKYGW